MGYGARYLAILHRGVKLAEAQMPTPSSPSKRQPMPAPSATPSLMASLSCTTPRRTATAASDDAKDGVELTRSPKSTGPSLPDEPRAAAALAAGGERQNGDRHSDARVEKPGANGLPARPKSAGYAATAGADGAAVPLLNRLVKNKDMRKVHSSNVSSGSPEIARSEPVARRLSATEEQVDAPKPLLEVDRAASAPVCATLDAHASPELSGGVGETAADTSAGRAASGEVVFGPPGSCASLHQRRQANSDAVRAATRAVAAAEEALNLEALEAQSGSWSAAETKADIIVAHSAGKAKRKPKVRPWPKRPA